MPAKLDFPASPTFGMKYPVPSVLGQPTYVWDGEKWTTAGGGAVAGSGASDAIPLADGVGYQGSAIPYSREDHVHPLNAATAAEYLANAAPLKTVTPKTAWDAAAGLPTISDASGTINIDMNTGIDFWVPITAAGRALPNPTNAKVGQKGIVYFANGAAATITTWGTMWKFSGGTKPALTLSGLDVMSYAVVSATIILCSFSQDFK